MTEEGYEPPTDPPKTYVPLIDLATRFNLPKKKAVLLHPRRAYVSDPFASKMAGQFAWPKSEKWPVCVDHGDIFVPILQLRADDVPELGFPGNTDLFQMLWCPDDHDDENDCAGYGPKTRTFWRKSADIGELLRHKNPPFNWSISNCVPAECKLYPERIDETPREIDDEIAEELEQYIMQNAQQDLDNMKAPQDYREGCYDLYFGPAPSTKVGGYCSWIQDGELPKCQCGEQMEHLLTVASGDAGDGASNFRWAPSDVARDESGFFIPQSYKGPDLCIGDVGSVYVYVCRICEGYRTACEFMCS